jgi:TolA-binding protein
LVERASTKMSNKTKFSSALILGLLLFSLSASLADNIDHHWEDFGKAAQLSAQNEDLGQVISLCKKIQKETEDPILFGRSSMLLADAYANLGNLEKAHQALRKVYQSKLKIPHALANEARLREGRLFLKQNWVEQASSLLRFVAMDDSSPLLQQEARVALAWQSAIEKNWEACDSLIEETVYSNPLYEHDYRVLQLKAQKAIEFGNPKAAIELLKDSESHASLQLLARAYEAAENPIMAVSVLKKVHDQYPGLSQSVQALFQAAEVFMRSGDFLAAEAELKRLLNDIPDGEFGSALHFRLGWVYLSLNRYENALDEFRRHSNPETVSYFKFMEAEVLRRMGTEDAFKLRKATQVFSDISSLHPRSPIAPLAKLKAALTEMERGDGVNAVISLRQFLTLYPKNKLAPIVNLLLAVNDKAGEGRKYLDNIINSNTGGVIFDAAFTALQGTDFRKGDYQEVINRSILVDQYDLEAMLNNWQRASRLLLAESAYFLGHYDLARTEYDRVAGHLADDLSQKASLGRAWCLLQTGKFDLAESTFLALRSQLTGPNQAHASFGLATVMFRTKRYGEALETYPVDIESKDQSLVPIITKSLFRKAECYYRLQDYAQAIKVWTDLVRNYPQADNAPSAKYQVADTYFRAGEFGKADSTLRLLIERYPNSTVVRESRLRLAQCAYNNNNYTLAVKRFQNFIRAYPEDEKTKDALDGMKLSYYQIGQTQQALEALEKVVQEFPQTDLAADARYSLAANYMQTGNHQAAVAAFKEILTLHPNSSYAMDAQFNLAKALLAQEDYEFAKGELERFMQYFPNSPQTPEALYLLGVCHFNLNSYLMATEYFDRISAQYQDTEFLAHALQNLGWCHERLGEKEKAITRFGEYLATKPDAPDSANIQLQIAKLLTESGQTDEANVALLKLQNVKSPDIAAEAHFMLGMAELSAENLKDAVIAFELAVQKGSRDNYHRLRALAQLGAIHENRGEWQKALSTYRLLVDSTSEDRWVRAAMERITSLSPKVSANDN